MSKKKAKKIRRIASDVIMVCLILIIALCAYNIASSIYKYHIGEKTYNEIAKIAEAPEAPEDVFSGDINFDALKRQNPDTVAWIHLKDTKINYPIVQASDNDKYLRRMFNGNKGIGGTLFVDYRIASPFNDFNTIVYGHSMKDSTMFGALKNYKNKSYASSHPTFDLVTPASKNRLEVVAFLHIPADSSVYNVVDSKNQAAKDAYVKLINSTASYTTGSGFTSKDTLVLLSTCAYDYDGARHVVVAKKIPW